MTSLKTAVLVASLYLVPNVILADGNVTLPGKAGIAKDLLRANKSRMGGWGTGKGDADKPVVVDLNEPKVKRLKSWGTGKGDADKPTLRNMDTNRSLSFDR
ncbi:hypothetical protein [Marimonas lutisalis]|uniref:hypothetical protein n=1 Tax=Marimonas lutisalis TaxID=2545756 RepID=UPI0010F5E59C|nr:hypothetical protein [Marimonas lutisalis]